MADLPRALSTDDAAFGDVMVAHPHGIAVWVDGELQADVSAYDMDQGFAVRAVKDEAGKLKLTEAGDAILTQRVHGVVTIAPSTADTWGA